MNPISDPLRAWLLHAVGEGASDLHIVAGYPPTLRVHGELRPVDVALFGARGLSDAEVDAALEPLLSAPARERFAAETRCELSRRYRRS